MARQNTNLAQQVQAVREDMVLGINQIGRIIRALEWKGKPIILANNSNIKYTAEKMAGQLNEIRLKLNAILNDFRMISKIEAKQVVVRERNGRMVQETLNEYVLKRSALESIYNIFVEYVKFWEYIADKGHVPTSSFFKRIYSGHARDWNQYANMETLEFLRDLFKREELIMSDVFVFDKKVFERPRESFEFAR